MLMAVDVRTRTDWEAGDPHALFRAPIAGDATSYRNHYAITTDGMRVVIDTVDDLDKEPITILTNWINAVK